jgi:hypothetical protein
VRRGAVLLLVVCAACGRKGPPLPPLVRTPSPPAELVAERRGDQVAIQFTVPNTNTDGTRPANVERVDVYAYTGSPAATDEELIREGDRVASVDVKAPSDPSDTVDPDEPSSDIQPLVGDGLDQGTRARVEETITPAITASADGAPDSGGGAVPLVGAPVVPPARIYIGVSINTRGRRASMSNRAEVPLVAAPAPPPAPTITYGETSLVVSWPAGASGAPSGPVGSAAGAVLPSRPVGAADASIGYHVYEMPADTRLTKEALTEARFVDERIEWGVERCYAVRVVQRIERLAALSDASPTVCVNPADKFPPASPSGLTALPTAGAINLIWDPNKEKDLAGYLILRGTAADMMAPLTGAPVAVPTYADAVSTGERFFYAVQAMDKNGNVSPPSPAVAETAR